MKATCHCGAVELTLTEHAPLHAAQRCDCSFCKRRQGANVSVPEGALTVTKGADKLSRYQWNKFVGEHFFCSICGIYTHHRRRSNPHEFGVNVGCLEGVSPKDLEPIPYFDGINHPSDR